MKILMLKVGRLDLEYFGSAPRAVNRFASNASMLSNIYSNNSLKFK
jgi:hypothetical protein